MGYYTLSNSKCEALGSSLSAFFIGYNTKNKQTNGGYTMSVLDLLRADGSIVVNKFMAKLIGLNEAIVLSELISWHKFHEDRNELKEDGLFYMTVEKLENNTTLTKHLQSKAITNLINYGLIEMKLKDLPAKRHFKIIIEAITDLVNNKKLKILTTDNHAEKCTKKADKGRGYQKLINSPTRSENNEQQEVKNFNASNNLLINNLLTKEEEEEKKHISESESVFLELIEGNKISKDTAVDILKTLEKTNQPITQFSIWTIRTTFAKLLDNATSIHHIPSWFATAIKGQHDKFNLTYAK
jgi:hypothetical protein